VSGTNGINLIPISFCHLRLVLFVTLSTCQAAVSGKNACGWMVTHIILEAPDVSSSSRRLESRSD
jgi:hypothetical protein